MTCNYDVSENNAEQVHGEFSPAFIHGWLCAYSCQTKYDDPETWRPVLLPDYNHQDNEQSNSLQAFIAAKQAITEKLHSSELAFTLPYDENDDSYTQAMVTRDWASGFWLAAEQTRLAKLVTHAEAAEFLADLPRIAAMPLPQADDTDSLVDLMEIQEYCRVGVMGVFLSARTHTP